MTVSWNSWVTPVDCWESAYTSEAQSLGTPLNQYEKLLVVGGIDFPKPEIHHLDVQGPLAMV